MGAPIVGLGDGVELVGGRSVEAVGVEEVDWGELGAGALDGGVGGAAAATDGDVNGVTRDRKGSGKLQRREVWWALGLVVAMAIQLFVLGGGLSSIL